MKTKLRLSELLMKLYQGDYLSDEEYSTYLQLVEDLKKKEDKHEKTRR
jgi:hypothetical protein